MSWLDAQFGVIFDDGDELEILGGLNFIGFAITADAENNRHNISVSGAATTSDDVSNESGVVGDSVSDALDTLSSSISGFVSTSRTITAGAGLTGGGDLSADRTFNVVAHADGTITVNADSIQVGTLVAGNYAANTIALSKLVNAGAAGFVGATGAGAWGALTGTQAAALLAGPIGATTTITTITATGLGTFVGVAAGGPVTGITYTGYGTGTQPASGLQRIGYVSVAGGGIIIKRVRTEGDSSAGNLETWNVVENQWYRGSSIVFGGIVDEVGSGGSYTLVIGGVTIGTWSATGLAMGSRAISGVTTLNGASVAAPVQGSAITTTTTINISSGSEYDVSSAGGAYAITLGTSGSPADGDTVILRASNALANAVTVTNGGTGGGNLGPSGVMTAALKATYTYYYDGTATAWKYGGRTRCA